MEDKWRGENLSLVVKVANMIAIAASTPIAESVLLALFQCCGFGQKKAIAA